MNININFNKNETELKMETSTDSFREKNIMLQLINCDELELAKEKRGHFLYCLFCPKETFLIFVFYLNL